MSTTTSVTTSTTSTTTATTPSPSNDDSSSSSGLDSETVTAIVVGVVCLGVLVALIGACLLGTWWFSAPKRQARKDEKQKEKDRLERETRQMLEGDDEEEEVVIDILDDNDEEEMLGLEDFEAMGHKTISNRNSDRMRRRRVSAISGSDSDDNGDERRPLPPNGGGGGNTLADYIARSVKGGILEDAPLEDVGPGAGIRVVEVKGLADTLIPIDDALRRSYFEGFEQGDVDENSPEFRRRQKQIDAFYKRQEEKLNYIRELKAKKEEYEKLNRFKNITSARNPEEVAAEERARREEAEIDALIAMTEKEDEVPLTLAEAERQRVQQVNDREYKRWVLENQEEKSHAVYGAANAEQAIARRLLSTTYFTAADPFRAKAEEAFAERVKREMTQEIAERLHGLRVKQHQLANQHRTLQQRPRTDNEALNARLRMALTGMTAGLQKIAVEIEEVEGELREAAGLGNDSQARGGGISDATLASLVGAAAAERIARWTGNAEDAVGAGGAEDGSPSPIRHDVHASDLTFPLHELPWMTADAVQALAKQVRIDNKKQIKAQRGIEPYFQPSGALDFEHPVSRRQLVEARRNSVMGGPASMMGSERGSAWDKSSYEGGARRERASTLRGGGRGEGSETGSVNDRASSIGSGRTKSVFYANNSFFGGSDRGSVFGAEGISQGAGAGGRKKHTEALPNSAFTPQMLKASHEILAEREGMFAPGARAKRAAALAKEQQQKKEGVSDESDGGDHHKDFSSNIEVMLSISKQKLVDKRSLVAMREQLAKNIRNLEEEQEEVGRDKAIDISLADEQLLVQLSPSARARDNLSGFQGRNTTIKEQKSAARKRALAEKKAKKNRRKLFKLLILQKHLEEDEIKDAKRKRRNRGRSVFVVGGDSKSVISGSDRGSSYSPLGSARESSFGRDSGYDRGSSVWGDGGQGGAGLKGSNPSDPKTPEEALAALQRHLGQHEELKNIAVEDLEDEFGAINEQVELSSLENSSNESDDGWMHVGAGAEIDDREEDALQKGLGGQVAWVRPEERSWFHTSQSPERRIRGAEKVANAQKLEADAVLGALYSGDHNRPYKTLEERFLLLEEQERQLEEAQRARRREERIKQRTVLTKDRKVTEPPEPLPMYETEVEWNRNTFAERQRLTQAQRAHVAETAPMRIVRALPKAEDDPYLHLL